MTLAWRFTDERKIKLVSVFHVIFYFMVFHMKTVPDIKKLSFNFLNL